MDVMHQRCCGLDVHKKKVVACGITPEGKETRTFSTMTPDLLGMGDWLAARGVTHVAMESTGVFWKPIFNLLEESFTLLVVNAYQIKVVPGRKTDVNDAQWIADLLRHGLVRGSFIPDRPHRELRELVRYRRSLVQQPSQVVNRIQEVLQRIDAVPGLAISFHPPTICPLGRRCARGITRVQANVRAGRRGMPILGFGRPGWKPLGPPAVGRSGPSWPLPIPSS